MNEESTWYDEELKERSTKKTAEEEEDQYVQLVLYAVHLFSFVAGQFALQCDPRISSGRESTENAV